MSSIQQQTRLDSVEGQNGFLNLIFKIALSLGLLTGGFAVSWVEFWPSAKESHFRQVVAALRDRQASAWELATSYQRNFPSDLRGNWLIAEAATRLGEHQQAIDFYRQLPEDRNELQFQRELGLGKQFFSVGDLREAESSLRRAVELNPHQLEACNRLGHLLQISGRVWESNPFFQIQIQRGKCRGDELLGMSPSDRFFRHDERLTRMSAEDSRALVIRLAEARNAIFDNREIEAEAILRTILQQYPDLGEAQGRLGRIILHRGNLREFLEWRAGLSDAARQHPEVSFVEGLQARELGQLEGAVHQFLITLERSPHHLGAHLQISSCLERLGRNDAAHAFSERSTILSEIDRNYNVLRSAFTEQTALDTVNRLGQIGRFWEAAGWCYVLTNLDQPLPQSRAALRTWVAAIHAQEDSGPKHLTQSLGLNSSDFAAPRWPALEDAPFKAQSTNPKTTPWKFTEEAGRYGIQFEYFDGTTRDRRLTHIFNTTGGGVGAVDYDADGWVDLYLAQGNDWRQPASQPEWFDRCFRNLGGERFVDVTLPAGLNETGFSQGVTVGDFNQDGFSDIYVGNVGPNTLYQNNGDGTFTDVSHRAGIAGDEWSTSSVFADFSGDGLPDLYVLNYSVRDETAEKECPTSDGVIKACTPDLLTAADDRCYLNLGNGLFQDISSEAGILAPDGRGLGVIAWDFGEIGRVSLFVANDTSANFLFQNSGTNSQGVPRFAEIGLISGLALDGDGNAQASMGIAAGDANGDGKLDLHITNFFADTNSLYLGSDASYFSDECRRFRLREPSFWMLGFGCQFADFDGDGWEDLVVANGHVDQVSSTGTQDMMPPQLFHNFRGAYFEEIPPQLTGEFFHRKALGRAVALLDWNRDGRIDFCVSHLHSPFALVTNQTAENRLPLIVRLIGRRGAREAVGALVTARIGNQRISRFVTAGSGFQASNESVIHLSWNGIDFFDELTVRWPDLHEQSWTRVSTGQEITLIEDVIDPVVLRTYATTVEAEDNSHPEIDAGAAADAQKPTPSLR